jgi:hypothetical protein
MHLTYQNDEAEVARVFASLAPRLGYDCVCLNVCQVLERPAAVSPKGLIGGLWSD